MRVPPLLCALILPLSVASAEWKLTIEAGDQDRQETIVEFQAPAELRGSFLLQDPSGAKRPMQVAKDGRGVFIEPQLAKGTKKAYAIKPGEPNDAITAKKQGDVLEIRSGEAKVADYQTTPGAVPEGVEEIFRHGAHLHPVYTPGGRLVTGNHPPDHRWHRGIWLAWTDTDYEGRHPDFWNMGKAADSGEKEKKEKRAPSGPLTGEVRFTALDRVWSGPVQAGFVSRHSFIDHTSGAEKEVLAETWEVAATRLGLLHANVIDLTSTQTLVGQTPLKLPKYHYGGLGVRGHAAWDPVDQVTMLTSNGDDRIKGDNSHANWVHMGGQVDGQAAGMVVLIHPQNYRFPQPLRLNPKNPQLCVAPSQDGDWAIEPGKPYVSRYRILAIDGPADAAAFDRAWNDYATPPKVTVGQDVVASK